MKEQRLTPTDLAILMSRNGSLPRRYCEDFVRSFFETIESGLVYDNVVKVKGLGTFKIVSVEARESVDVNTGERIEIASHNKVSFTPDANLRDAVNRPFLEFQTVILNENTDIAKMEELGSAEEKEPVSEQIENITEPAVSIEEPTEVEEPVVAEESVAAEEPAAKEPSVVEEPAVVEELVVVEEPVMAEEPAAKESAEVEEHVVAEEPVKVEEPVAKEPAEVEESITAEDSATKELVVAEEPAGKEPAVVEEPAIVEEESAVVENKVSSPSSVKDTNEVSLRHCHQKHSCRNNILWFFIAACLFLVLGYCVAYYWHPVALPEWSIENKNAKEIDSNDLVEDLVEKEPVLPSEEESQQPAGVKDFPQLEGGEYWIVGIVGEETMTPDKTLLNISLKYYKNKDFFTYICTMNGISNPDIVPLNKLLSIPDLRNKESGMTPKEEFEAEKHHNN